MTEQKPTAEATKVADEIVREWCRSIDFLAQTHEHNTLVERIATIITAKDAEIKRLNKCIARLCHTTDSPRVEEVQQRALLVEITESDFWQASSPDLNNRVMKALSTPAVVELLKEAGK